MRNLLAAIIADVHSNRQALEAVLSEARGRGAERIICAGDTVGYGASPVECSSLIKTSCWKIVLGNHDECAITRDTSFMNPYAAKAILWTAARIDPATSDWLKSLPIGDRFDLHGTRCALYHGSVESNTEYVYEDEAKESMLSRTHAQLLIFGHTHVPFVRSFKSGTILNPGSVGQPRDGQWRSSFAMYDTETSKCTIVRTEYDIDRAAAAIDEAGLPEFLADRLYSGT